MIPVAKPVLDEQEVEAVRRVILSGWVTQGPEVKAFEQEFAAYVGSQFACAVSSCTTALHLALKAVGVGPGDEVITVSHSFIATANSIRYCGAVPVFVDIEPGTFNMNPALIEPAITGSTKAILCVHQMGMPCDLSRIVETAHRHNLKVVEDAACAIGSEALWDGEWQRIGRPHGDIACFSFHPRKLLTTGDGGMLTTNNAEYDAKFRLWRQHSMSVPDTARHAAKSVVLEEYTELGYNYRMTDIQAAIGRVQLERLPQMLARRHQFAQRYFGLLSSVPGLGLPVEPGWARSNWQSFCVRLPDGTDQKTVMQQMLDAGVATRRGVMNAHLEPAYRREPWRCVHGRTDDCACLRESERAQEHCILLPLYHQMTEPQQGKVVDELRAWFSD
jgi:dTDP-4-amino-4,6-dideoxygalactose transaminase